MISRRPRYRPGFSTPVIEMILLCILMVFGVFLRWYGLDRQSLWSDELFAVVYSHKNSFSDLLAVMKQDSNPPGYVTFMYYMLPWVGYSDIAIRLHSFIAGCLLLLAMYLFGRRLFSASVGLVALVLMVVNHNAILYSQEARCYAMLALDCLIYSYFFIDIFIRKNSGLFGFFSLFLTAVIALYLHYVSLVFIGLSGLWFMVSYFLGLDSVFRVRGLIVYLAVLVFFYPWASIMAEHMVLMDFWAKEPELRNIFFALMFFWGGHTFSWYFHLLGVSGAIFLAVFSVYSKKSLTEFASKVLFLSVMLIGPMLVFYIKSKFSQPVFVERYFMCSLPAALMLPAIFYGWVIDKISIKGLRLLVMALFCVAFFYTQLAIDVEEGLYGKNKNMQVREAALSVALDEDFNKLNSGAIFYGSYFVSHYF
ncbi:MAG TPA: glycosyltransferase family 39 protein, partial [Pseudomonadales bacterium]|nr:glycosyltransferase family 39 protein [Pseudomonadales bacterium]